MNKRTFIRTLPYIVLALGCFQVAHASEISGTFGSSNTVQNGSASDGALSGTVVSDHPQTFAANDAGTSNSRSGGRSGGGSSSVTASEGGQSSSDAAFQDFGTSVDSAPVSSESGLVAFNTGDQSGKASTEGELAANSGGEVSPTLNANLGDNSSLAAVGAANSPLDKIVLITFVGLMSLGAGIYAVNKFVFTT